MLQDGAETMAVNMIWLMSLLLKNREVLKRIQEELDAKVGRERWVEDYDIDNLVYLQAAVKESMRLYPPAPFLVPHKASEDCNVDGYYVPKGTQLFVNVWKLHRDPRIWPEPEKFSPERFLTTPENVDPAARQYGYIPFSYGRRSCPGISYGLKVTHLTYARLLQGFDLSPPANMAVDMSEALGITMPRANPLEAVITPRLPSALYAAVNPRFRYPPSITSASFTRFSSSTTVNFSFESVNTGVLAGKLSFRIVPTPPSPSITSNFSTKSGRISTTSFASCRVEYTFHASAAGAFTSISSETAPNTIFDLRGRGKAEISMEIRYN
nr:cytochrome P450 82C4-like [Ipomoea batatas]